MAKKKYTKEFLISELHRLTAELNHIPTSIDIRRVNGYPSCNTYTRTFGSWNNALLQANLCINKESYYTERTLISELHRFVYVFGHVPLFNEINVHPDYPSGFPYLARFGSWNNALIVAKLPVNKEYVYNEDFLISELVRFVDNFGYIPTEKEISNTIGYPSSSTFENYFGSWNNAIISANLKPNIIHVLLTGNEICSMCGATESASQWHFQDSERICTKCYRKSAKNKSIQEDRTRNFGCNPINNWFENSHFHHLHLGNDHNIGLYIPADLHRSIRHNSKTGIGMDEINKLAIAWFWEELKNDKI